MVGKMGTSGTSEGILEAVPLRNRSSLLKKVPNQRTQSVYFCRTYQIAVHHGGSSGGVWYPHGQRRTTRDGILHELLEYRNERGKQYWVISEPALAICGTSCAMVVSDDVEEDFDGIDRIFATAPRSQSVPSLRTLALWLRQLRTKSPSDGLKVYLTESNPSPRISKESGHEWRLVAGAEGFSGIHPEASGLDRDPSPHLAAVGAAITMWLSGDVRPIDKFCERQWFDWD